MFMAPNLLLVINSKEYTIAGLYFSNTYVNTHVSFILEKTIKNQIVVLVGKVSHAKAYGLGPENSAGLIEPGWAWVFIL